MVWSTTDSTDWWSCFDSFIHSKHVDLWTIEKTKHFTWRVTRPTDKQVLQISRCLWVGHIIVVHERREQEHVRTNCLWMDWKWPKKKAAYVFTAKMWFETTTSDSTDLSLHDFFLVFFSCNVFDSSSKNKMPFSCNVSHYDICTRSVPYSWFSHSGKTTTTRSNLARLGNGMTICSKIKSLRLLLNHIACS